MAVPISISDLGAEYSRLWDEAVVADNARYASDCYGDLPKDRGPHVLGRSEKGLAADIRYAGASTAKATARRQLRARLEQEVGIDPWKLRCLFV